MRKTIRQIYEVCFSIKSVWYVFSAELIEIFSVFAPFILTKSFHLQSKFSCLENQKLIWISAERRQRDTTRWFMNEFETRYREMFKEFAKRCNENSFKYEAMPKYHLVIMYCCVPRKFLIPVRFCWKIKKLEIFFVKRI